MEVVEHSRHEQVALFDHVIVAENPIDHHHQLDAVVPQQQVLVPLQHQLILSQGPQLQEITFLAVYLLGSSNSFPVKISGLHPKLPVVLLDH